MKLFLRRRWLRCRRSWRLGRCCRLRRRWCRLDARQNRVRRRHSAATHRKDRQSDRCDHEENSRPGGCLGKSGGCAARTECGLAAHATESSGDIAALAALEQHHDNQKETDQDVHGVDQTNQPAHELTNQTGLRPAFLVFDSYGFLVRKGGFEPPRLSAPPPQDGVSASSTTSALNVNQLRETLLEVQEGT